MKQRTALGAGILVLSMVFTPLAATAEQPAPGLYGSVYQAADGMWLNRENGDTYMYFAGAVRFANLATQKLKTIAFADKSKCAVAKTKNLKVIACSGSARATRIDDSQFAFDPAMSDTRVDFKSNHVKWEGQDVPEPSVYPFADPSFGALAFASVDRWAIASGRVLGTKFKANNSDIGFLSQGLYAGVLLSAPAAEITMDENGVVHYRFRFETR